MLASLRLQGVLLHNWYKSNMDGSNDVNVNETRFISIYKNIQQFVAKGRTNMVQARTPSVSKYKSL